MFLTLGFWGRVFVFLSLAVFLMLCAVVVGDVLATIVFGKAAVFAMEVPVMQFLQTFLSVGLFLLPPVLMVLLCCEGPLAGNLMVARPPRLLPLLVCIAAIVAAEPMVSWLEDVNMRMRLPEGMSSVESWMRVREQAANDAVQKLLAAPGTLNYIVNLGVLALLPGVCEEMFFRVGVQTRLLGDKSRIRGVWAVVLTAALFSALHLQFFGFLPRMVLGVLLGFFLLITGNAWYSVAAHFVNNMFVVALGCGPELQLPQWMGAWWAVLASATATAAMLWLLWLMEKKSKNAL